MKLKFIVCRTGSADWAEGTDCVEAIDRNGGQQADLQWRQMLEEGQLFMASGMIWGGGNCHQPPTHRHAVKSASNVGPGGV